MATDIMGGIIPLKNILFHSFKTKSETGYFLMLINDDFYYSTKYLTILK